MATLFTESLSLRYGNYQALSEISVELAPGITGLVGPNGAGKTSFMRLVMGLLAPSNGRISLLGGNPFKTPELRLKAGYLPQSFNPPAQMRVAAYLEYLALLSGLTPRLARQGVAFALERVALADRGTSRISSLSGGMLRRVGVAQAIMHQPHLLILDEPAAGLDPAERLRLYGTLREMLDGQPALVSSHHVDEIEREADNVWFMSKGRIVWSGSVHAALNSMIGRVREGVLPEGETPHGKVVSRKRTASGTQWRVVGDDTRLELTDPTLLDAYFEYVGDPAASG